MEFSKESAAKTITTEFEVTSSRKCMTASKLYHCVISVNLALEVFVAVAAGPKLRASPQIVFGPFEYDETAGTLYKHGIRIRLQGQPLRILSMLLRRSGQVVAREEFQEELWQGDAFGDFEQGLNAAMNRLRRTLGDSAEHPHYVETLTLPCRGYRFIAPVHVVSLQPALPVLASDPPVPANKHSSQWGVRQWLALAAALVAAIAGGYWAGHQNGAAHQNLISQQ